MRIIKIEKRVYEYSELQVHAKDIVRNYILSVLHDSDTFSKTIKKSIEFLGFKDVELYYNLEHSSNLYYLYQLKQYDYGNTYDLI